MKDAKNDRLIEAVVISALFYTTVKAVEYASTGNIKFDDFDKRFLGYSAGLIAGSLL